MPVYYTDADVTLEDFAIAQAAWDMILSKFMTLLIWREICTLSIYKV